MTKISAYIATIIIFGCSGSGSNNKLPIKPSTTVTSQNPIPTYTDMNSGSMISDCTPTNCTRADADIKINDTSTRLISATVGTNSAIKISVNSIVYPARRIGIVKITPSPNVNSLTYNGTGTITSSVNLNWTPLSSDATSGTLSLTVRDIDYCMSQSADISQCELASFSDARFDVPMTVSWSLFGTGSTVGGSSSNSMASLSTAIGLISSLLGSGGSGSTGGSLFPGLGGIGVGSGTTGTSTSGGGGDIFDALSKIIFGGTSGSSGLGGIGGLGSTGTGTTPSGTLPSTGTTTGACASKPVHQCFGSCAWNQATGTCQDI
jgi:hypothetical protein